MIDFVLVGVGLATVCGVGTLVVIGSRQAAANKARFQKLLAENEWSLTPTHPDAGKFDQKERRWGFFGKSSTGLDWEVYLLNRQKAPDELYFRAPTLKLPQLELAIGQKTDLSKLKEVIPTIESLANSFLGKMIMSLAEKSSSKLGATPRDLIEFLKVAEERPVGSSQFQAGHSVLTRGSLPIENILTPSAEQIIEAWRDRHFHLSWGINGLAFHIRATYSQCPGLARDFVRLGELLTGGASRG